MAQNPMQDIVPKGAKSIRRITPPEIRTRPVAKPLVRPAPRHEEIRARAPQPTIERAPKVEEKPEEVEIRITHDEIDTIETVRHEFEASRARSNSRGRGFKKHWKKITVLGGIITVLIGVIVLSNMFHGATVTVTPRTQTQNIQKDYIAKRIPASSELGYNVVTVKQSGSETIKATGEKQVEKKATGTIVIFNNYSTAVQRLIKNTRFATPEGVIFRIVDSVTVPGKKGTTPGSVEASVVADGAGESYNVGLKDFTIPGFKGDPRYTTFYARSKTPIAGGFSGVQKIVADADRAKAKSNIESKISAELIKQIPVNVSPEVTYFPGAYTIEFTALPEESASASEVTIKEEGVLSIVVFDKKTLGAAVASVELAKYDRLPVILKNAEELTFKSKGDFKPGSTDSISFTLSGPAKFEWLYDENGLKKALLGKSRSEIPAALQKYPTIEKADISLRPFWSRSFPDSLEKVIIKKAL